MKISFKIIGLEDGASKQKRSSPMKTRDKNYHLSLTKAKVQLYIYTATEVFLFYFRSYDNCPKSA